MEINKDGLLEIDIYFWDSEWETWLQKYTGFTLTDNINSEGLLFLVVIRFFTVDLLARREGRNEK